MTSELLYQPPDPVAPEPNILDLAENQLAWFGEQTMYLFSDPVCSIFEALAKAQGEMGSAVKNAKNTYLDSDYADLNSLRQAITKPLTDNNIAVSQIISAWGGRQYLITTLGHASGEWIRSTLKLRDIDNDQQLGSHLTYMRRYALSAITNQAQHDDDGASANQPAISADDIKILEKMLKDRGTDMTKFNKWLVSAIGVPTLAEVPGNRFDEVLSAVKSSKKPAKKGAANDNT